MRSHPFSLVMVFAAVHLAALGEDSMHDRIDQLVEAGQTALIAEITDDAEFLRRVHLDFGGVIPDADTVRGFLTDAAPDKRQRVIDQLLKSPDYAPTMRDRFNIHLMERRGKDDLWLAWLEAAFKSNKPWDQMTRELIRADFRDESSRGAAFFYSNRLTKSGQVPTDYPGLTRDVGRLFLGMDLQCAQCHNHKLIKDYDQIDFQGLMAGFSKLKLVRGDFPTVEEQLTTKKLEYASVFTGEPRVVGPRIPGLEEIEPVVFKRGEEYVQKPDRKTKTLGIPKFSPLTEFAQQIHDAPTFSKNIVNRIWHMMMGRGIVEPLDQFHSANPPSNPELLELLASEFEKHRYDLKWLFGELALTKTYQRSSRFPDGASPDRNASFLVASERRLSAEQLLASTLRAISVKAEDAPLKNVKPEDENEDEFVGLESRFEAAFANEPKNPELEFAPGMKAALFAMNDEEVGKLLERNDALPSRLARETDTRKIVEELSIHIFGRMPTDLEILDTTKFIDGSSGSRKVAIVDLAWAMLNSTEFVTNH